MARGVTKGVHSETRPSAIEGRERTDREVSTLIAGMERKSSIFSTITKSYESKIVRQSRLTVEGSKNRMYVLTFGIERKRPNYPNTKIMKFLQPRDIRPNAPKTTLKSARIEPTRHVLQKKETDENTKKR